MNVLLSGLWAVITNAAVGCFGEALWLTSEQNHRMMDVNFWGSVNFTKAFEPMLLSYKSKVSNFTILLSNQKLHNNLINFSILQVV
jgi:NAD(P)-dependent dehydrogenase (short-subunit alcohol dehydrogenase family)